MTTSGKALNTKFNSSGNFGYPPDGGGIGAGSAQVDLRSLEAKRVLVLVDGIRWVNESSASGVSGSADLNTIPMAIVDRLEVLEDGASAIYGSDAIAGVVNIIPRKEFDGIELNGYYGEYEDGGGTSDVSLVVGGSGDRFSGVFVASYYDSDDISSADWWQSAVAQPYAGPGAGSSGIPQGRYEFCDPSRPAGSYGFCDPGGELWYDVTLTDGTTTPVWNPADPSSGTYHDFSGADRFNYAPYNLLLTRSERRSMSTESTLKIDVPAGVEDSNYMTMRGEGNAGKRGGQSGDIIVVFQELPHEHFIREKNDIIYNLFISFPQAALGAEVEVPTLTENQ